MNRGLDRLNSLPPEQAAADLLKCCGSTRWARVMAQARPFANVDQLLRQSDSVWWSLGEPDWLEAFQAHPKIGEKKAAGPQSEAAQRWSEQEQSGTRTAAPETMVALAESNRAYERRFGHIFIVCATGKTSEEMLAILKARLRNNPETELRVAAEEQRRITRLRLEKSLESGV